ncbi:dirigent protein 22-like [Papaver somniferum]|uniref:dirigent protein 22-like n=1 Tax=Papaver somniferum TaxID=3469 RepID=UPI000E703A37|nr:dirigent protein 22-like [Papaver somniferum]
MAEYNPKSSLLLISLSICAMFLINNILAVDGKSQTFGRVLSLPKLGLKKQKLSHFHMYWHDVVAGSRPTAVVVAKAPTTSKSNNYFGGVVMIDDALTEGPELSSRLIGRAQGFYASAGIHEAATLVNMNLAFIVGKYNGSTLSIMGRDKTLSPGVREMPIIGGSGLFRFARGYVQLRTHHMNSTSGDTTIEYNIYVFHY